MKTVKRSPLPRRRRKAPCKNCGQLSVAFGGAIRREYDARSALRDLLGFHDRQVANDASWTAADVKRLAEIRAMCAPADIDDQPGMQHPRNVRGTALLAAVPASDYPRVLAGLKADGVDLNSYRAVNKWLVIHNWLPSSALFKGTLLRCSQ